MKKYLIMVIAALCSHSVVAACPSQSQTVFSCTTKNNKVIQVCDAGKSIQYTFGKLGQAPEMNLKVLRNKVTTYQWSGGSSYENYAVNIPNGNTVYRVNSSIDKHAQKYTAGVVVSQNEKILADVQCNMKKPIIDNLEGIDLESE